MPGMATVGSYLATRLEQIGLKHYFVVPGDYNLVLLDQLLLNRNLEQVGCCNELNCSFAAEGYARAQGAAACVVTYNVGAFSAFNGIAGAYAESLPVILISGAPNTNAVLAGQFLHHTLGTHDLSYQFDMARRITCEAVALNRAEDAPFLIDQAIRAALRENKPAYIEIPCNLAAAPCPAPGPISAVLETSASDPASLEAAVQAAADFLNKSIKPLLLAGSHLQTSGAVDAFRELAEALDCAVAVMPNAKGLFPEAHPQFIGVSWGAVSSPGCNEIVDWSDAILAAGPLFSDVTTTGWTGLPADGKLVQADPDRVRMPGVDVSGVRLAEFLSSLKGKVKRNGATLVEFNRDRLDPRQPAVRLDGPLTRREIMRQVQGFIDGDSTLFVETGDSWFNAMSLDLPEGCKLEVEMQWGHIGWSIPSAFGYAVAPSPGRTVVLVGDGSFQMTAQEVSQMVRHNLPVVIFLMNNRGYTIEVEIHDGPYNNIKNWSYAGLMNVYNAAEGSGQGFCVTTGHELAAAIELARANATGPTLIECIIDRDDCSKELLEWGAKLAAANLRRP